MSPLTPLSVENNSQSKLIYENGFGYNPALHDCLDVHRIYSLCIVISSALVLLMVLSLLRDLNIPQGLQDINFPQVSMNLMLLHVLQGSG